MSISTCVKISLSKLIRECRTKNKRKPHNKLQQKIFSILLTFVFVSCSSVCCVCVAFLLTFFSFVSIVPIVRCHELCCSARRAWWIGSSYAFLLRCLWFRAPVDREGALRLNVQVRVFWRISVRLTRTCVWPPSSKNVVLHFLSSAFSMANER